MDKRQYRRFKRHVHQAEERINTAIIKRMDELRADPNEIRAIDDSLVDDLQHIKKEGMKHVQHMLASLGKRSNV